MAELLPDILNGTIEPGKVFDVGTGLDGVPGRVPGHGRPQGTHRPSRPTRHRRAGGAA
jgi:hypothetical protein